MRALEGGAMSRIVKIRSLPTLPPNVRWLVELECKFTARRFRAKLIRTRFAVVDYNPDAFGRGAETMAFPASEDGEVLDWGELAVSHEIDMGRAFEEVINDLEGLE